MERPHRIALLAVVALTALSGCNSSSPPARPAAAGGQVQSESTTSSSTTTTVTPTTGTTVPAHRVEYSASGAAPAADCPPPVALKTDIGTVHGRGLRMVSAQRGFAVDDTSVVVTDDGRTWSRRWSGSEPMYSVEALDADHAWAVGQHLLLATTDGGRTWSARGEPDGAQLRVVDFSDAQNGWGVTEADVYRTADSGRTWSAADPPCGGEAVCFTGVDDGWAAAGPYVYRTVDGGRSWVPAFTVPLDGIDRPFNVHSVHAAQLECSRPGVVWAFFTGQASGSHIGYVAYHGVAGGGWTPVLKEPVAGPQAVHAPAAGAYPAPMWSFGPDSALFVQYSPLARAPDALALRLATGGGTALGPARPIPGLLTATSISFPSPDSGWVLGAKSGPDTVDAILATTDGGRTWEEQYSNVLPFPTG